MKMDMNINFKNIPPYVKTILAVIPSVIVAVAVVFVFIMPKQKEVKALDAKIDEQNNQISVDQAKAAKLDVLMKENENLLIMLGKMKEWLPEEKEISGLLKQVSDIGADSGLDVKSWRPGQKSNHPSGIVYEIPVSVSVVGTFHDLGKFLSSLTTLKRIVNINNIQLGVPQVAKGNPTLQISFTASTFSAIPEAEGGKK